MIERLTKETLLKAYAADNILKAVADLDNSDVAKFEELLALNTYMTAAEVVELCQRNPKWGELAAEKFLQQKAHTITDDDVTEIGYHNQEYGNRALKVYTSNFIPTASAIEKMVSARKDLGRQALDALLAKPNYISVMDILTLSKLDYVWARQAFEAFYEEKRSKNIKIEVEDIVRLNEADAKWGRKAQRLWGAVG